MQHRYNNIVQYNATCTTIAVLHLLCVRRRRCRRGNRSRGVKSVVGFPRWNYQRRTAKWPFNCTGTNEWCRYRGKYRVRLLYGSKKILHRGQIERGNSFFSVIYKRVQCVVASSDARRAKTTIKNEKMSSTFLFRTRLHTFDKYNARGFLPPLYFLVFPQKTYDVFISDTISTRRFRCPHQIRRLLLLFFYRLAKTSLSPGSLWEFENNIHIGLRVSSRPSTKCIVE